MVTDVGYDPQVRLGGQPSAYIAQGSDVRTYEYGFSSLHQSVLQLNV